MCEAGKNSIGNNKKVGNNKKRRPPALFFFYRNPDEKICFLKLSQRMKT